MSVITMSTNRDIEGDDDMNQDDSIPKMTNEVSTVSDDDMANSTGRLYVAPSATEENDGQGAEVEKDGGEPTLDDLIRNHPAYCPNNNDPNISAVSCSACGVCFENSVWNLITDLKDHFAPEHEPKKYTSIRPLLEILMPGENAADDNMQFKDMCLDNFAKIVDEKIWKDNDGSKEALNLRQILDRIPGDLPCSSHIEPFIASEKRAWGKLGVRTKDDSKLSAAEFIGVYRGLSVFEFNYQSLDIFYDSNGKSWDIKPFAKPLVSFNPVQKVREASINTVPIDRLVTVTVQRRGNLTCLIHNPRLFGSKNQEVRMESDGDTTNGEANCILLEILIGHFLPLQAVFSTEALDPGKELLLECDANYGWRHGQTPKSTNCCEESNSTKPAQDIIIIDLSEDLKQDGLEHKAKPKEASKPTSDVRSSRLQKKSSVKKTEEDKVRSSSRSESIRNKETDIRKRKSESIEANPKNPKSRKTTKVTSPRSTNKNPKNKSMNRVEKTAFKFSRVVPREDWEEKESKFRGNILQRIKKALSEKDKANLEPAAESALDRYIEKVEIQSGAHYAAVARPDGKNLKNISDIVEYLVGQIISKKK